MEEEWNNQIKKINELATEIEKKTDELSALVESARQLAETKSDHE